MTNCLEVYNRQLAADNVIIINFDENLNEKIDKTLNYREFYSRGFKVTPQWNGDLTWISPNCIEDHRLFEDIFFNKLNIPGRLLEENIRLPYNIRMYCGFIVTRSICNAPTFHVDWKNTGNNAFTLITPLSPASDELGLIYKTRKGDLAIYKYQPGQAIIFCDNFLHSSLPTKTPSLARLLSFTFGTDDMAIWPNLEETAGLQSNIFRLPNGDFRIRNLDAYGL